MIQERTYRVTINITTMNEVVARRLQDATKGGFIALRDPSLHKALERGVMDGKIAVDGVIKVEDDNDR